MVSGVNFGIFCISNRAITIPMPYRDLVIMYNIINHKTGGIYTIDQNKSKLFIRTNTCTQDGSTNNLTSNIFVSASRGCLK